MWNLPFNNSVAPENKPLCVKNIAFSTTQTRDLLTFSSHDTCFHGPMAAGCSSTVLSCSLHGIQSENLIRLLPTRWLGLSSQPQECLEYLTSMLVRNLIGWDQHGWRISQFSTSSFQVWKRTFHRLAQAGLRTGNRRAFHASACSVAREMVSHFMSHALASHVHSFLLQTSSWRPPSDGVATRAGPHDNGGSSTPVACPWCGRVVTWFLRMIPTRSSASFDGVLGLDRTGACACVSHATV